MKRRDGLYSGAAARLLFDGAVEPERGYLQRDLDRPGLGLELKRADAAHYLV
jgi:hypothetical protein